MKKITTILILLLVQKLAFAPASLCEKYNARKNLLLVYSMVSVESSFRLDAINRAENALGILQIRSCVIRDVNRYYGLSLKHKDVLNPFIALQVFDYYTKMYGAKTVRDKIMLWNMGPKAMKYKNFTNDYYEKVMKAYYYYEENL